MKRGYSGGDGQTVILTSSSGRSLGAARAANDTAMNIAVPGPDGALGIAATMREWQYHRLRATMATQELMFLSRMTKTVQNRTRHTWS